MKKYKIIKTIYLDFLTPQDQETYALDKGFVTVDGEKVVYIKENGKHLETINWAWIIEKYYQDGYLELIKDNNEKK